MLPVKLIVCPTDFSEPSFRALDVAVALAGHFGAGLILVHVVPPLPSVSAAALAKANVDLGEYDRMLTDNATQRLGEVAATHPAPGLDVRTEVRGGVVADEIVELAATAKADLIVIATNGETGWRRFVFGSVAEKVVRLARCPVLTVHGPDQESIPGQSGD